ncbi:MAG: c-type cytochrome domain-containing protein [Verrucomicrobiales bacterium]
MKRFTVLLFCSCALHLLPASAVEFDADILPIFEAKCAKCHMEGSSKGGLALDATDIGKQIGEGKAIVPGDAEKSDLLKLVSLPEDDEDHMPPAGKGTPLRDNEIAKLKEWIEAGATVGGEKPAMKEDEKPADGLTKRPEPIEGNWTNKDGKVITATLIRVEGESAVLLMNGNEFKYPVANLSVGDQTKIREFSEASKKSTGG